MFEHPTGPGAQGKAELIDFNHYCRKAGWDYVTETRTVCNGPCFLLNVLVCSSGTAAAVVQIYNGHSANARQLADLGVLTSQMQDFPLRHPLFMSNGIHIVIPDNILSVTVHYLPVPD